VQRIVAVREHAAPFHPSPSELPALLLDSKVFIWVDLAESEEENHQKFLRDVFQFHPIALEVCFAELERPKIESYDGYLYCVTHGLALGASPQEHEVVELDAFLGQRFLVTYHAKESRSVASVWDFVLRSGEPLRRGPSALLQAILDRQVDGIEPVLDDLEVQMDEMEEHVLARPAQQDLAALVAIRRNILHLRRWIGLQRDVVLRLSRNEPLLVPPAEALLFRDTYDHLARFTELLETYREVTHSIQEATLSVINNRLGENMKLLTVFSVVLLPLSLLAGIYGMNFTFMPGLSSPYGFLLMLLTMLVVAGSLLFFFWRKGWLGKNPPARWGKTSMQERKVTPSAR
jgi:magnesium transporter